MDTKEAIRRAKTYIEEVFADEQLSNLGLEEIEHDPASGAWRITVAFSRPWSSPRTQAQATLESLGVFSNLRRSYKVVTIDSSGQVISMKSRSKAEAE
jgi:hypothetical protein